MAVSERTDWFELWFADKTSILEQMLHNMQADLDAGYDPNGKCITDQKAEIAHYKAMFQWETDQFKNMDDKQVNRWCYYDMKKRGAIS